jgi:hypothetical protein
MTIGRQEWDLQKLRSCMYMHDIDEVLKIRLSERIQEDTIA